MGNTAYSTLLDGKEITKNHGKFIKKDGRMFFVTYHPAAAIYNQKLITGLKDDFRKLAEFLKNDDSHVISCLLYTSPSPRDGLLSRMPSSA